MPLVDRELENVIEQLKEEGVDILLVGKMVGFMGGARALGFYFVAERGKVQPETLRKAEVCWDPELKHSDWEEKDKEGINVTWWTGNGEDMIGDLDVITEALKVFLENREWEEKKS